MTETETETEPRTLQGTLTEDAVATRKSCGMTNPCNANAEYRLIGFDWYLDTNFNTVACPSCADDADGDNMMELFEYRRLKPFERYTEIEP